MGDLVKNYSWSTTLIEKIGQLLEEILFPLRVVDLERIDPWFEGVSTHVEFVKNLISMTLTERLYFLEINGDSYFSRIRQVEWNNAVREAAVRLAKLADQGWNENDIRVVIESRLPESIRPFEDLLWSEVSKLCHFATTRDGERKLVGYGKGAREMLRLILTESDKPLHRTEIAARAKFIYGCAQKPLYITNQLINVGLLFGPGTYGLPQHNPLTEHEMIRLCHEVEHIMRSSSSSKQWNTTELIGRMPVDFKDGFKELNKYLLNIALSTSSKFQYLGRMTWSLRRQDSAEVSRIKIHQTVVDILTEAGRPLKTFQILERLTEVRGVSEYFQIHPFDPIVRLGPGYWGLKGRDAPLAFELGPNWKK